MNLTLSSQIQRITQSLEDAKRLTTTNGISVIIAQNTSDSAHYLSLCYDIAPHRKSNQKGIEFILADIFQTGGGNLKNERLIQFSDTNAVKIFANPSKINIYQHKNDIDSAIFLLSQIYFYPNYEVDNFNKIRQNQLVNLFPPMVSPNKYITDIARFSLYGDVHPKGEMPDKDRVSKLNVLDLKNYYTKYYAKSKIHIAVITPDNADSVFQKINTYFSTYTYLEQIPEKFPEIAQPEHNKIYFHEIPDTITGNATYLSLVYPLKKEVEQKDNHAVTMLMKILGAHKSGRFYKRMISEENVSEFVFSTIENGEFDFSAIFKPADLDKLLKFYNEEISKIKTEKVGSAELNVAFNLLKSDFIDDLKEPAFLLSFLCNVSHDELPADYFSDYLDGLQKIDGSDIQSVAQTYLQNEPYVCAVLGKELQVKNEFYAVAESTETVIMREQKPVEIIPYGFSSKNIIVKYLEAVQPVIPDEGQYLQLQGIYDFGSHKSVVRQEIYRKKQNYVSKFTFVTDSAKLIEFKKEARCGNGIWSVSGSDSSEVLSADYHGIITRSYGFQELEYDYKHITVDFIELINVSGKEFYKVKIRYPYGIVCYDYFDKETSLKTKSEYFSFNEANEELFLQTIEISDYRRIPKTKNSLIPYKKRIITREYKADFELIKINYDAKIPKHTFDMPNP